MNLLNVFDLGLTVTVSGVVIVFGMLIILVCLLSVFGIVSRLKEKRENKKNSVKFANASETKQDDILEIEDTKNTVNGEIIAVISAAVAAMYSKSDKKPVIKSIKRNSSSRSAWASAGILDNTRAF